MLLSITMIDVMRFVLLVVVLSVVALRVSWRTKNRIKDAEKQNY
jgi:hypothetical protein